MANRAAIILAAGQGTRMKSDLPKVLHKVGGRAMVDWSIELARNAGCEKIVVVISKTSNDLRQHITSRLGEDAIAVQDPPLGTGHAVQAAEPAMEGFEGDLVVLYGSADNYRLEHVNGESWLSLSSGESIAGFASATALRLDQFTYLG